jgi:hypothetical protein
LPFLEQSSLFNAFNRNVHYETAPNSTVVGTGLSLLWCPSDGLVSQPDSKHFGWPVRFCSYLGSSGTWNTPPEFRAPICNLQDFQAFLAQANGVIFYYSSVRLAGISRGPAYSSRPAQSRYPHRRPAQPHDRGAACIYFTHFWGKGPATELAQGLRSAPDAQKAASQPNSH